MTLATTEAGRCPDCGDKTTEMTTEQRPLLRGGGYGASRRHTWRACTSCSYALCIEIGEVTPR